MNSFPYDHSQPNPPSSDEQLYRVTRNWAEFGIWLSAGLLATFAAREVPALRSLYCLIVVGVFLLLRFTRREEHVSEAVLVVGVALGVALIGGTWDCAWDFLMLLISLLKR